MRHAMTASRTISYAVGVCDHNGAVEKTGLFEPGGAGHFAIAVEREPGAEYGVERIFAARKNGGNAGADWTFAYYEFAVAGDWRGVSDFYAADVGDGVVGAGSAIEWDAEVSELGAWFEMERDWRNRRPRLETGAVEIAS